MKRVLAFLIFVILCSSITAHAKSGDINGGIFATDIIAYINGVEVASYNIGGKTVVIIEEITENYYYNDELRTLIVNDLAPDYLIEGKNPRDVLRLKKGKKIGNTYETDIETYIYNKQMTAYSLNGKMAIAIEDIGNDNQFSDIGGKYIWDSKNRTISLEFMYRNVGVVYKLMRDSTVNMTISDNYEIDFISDPINNGNISGFKLPHNDVPQPLTINGELAGYICYPTYMHFYCDENNLFSLISEKGTAFFYLYDHIIAEKLAEINPIQPTRQDWLDYYETQMHTIIDSFETEEYTFLYTGQPNFHGSSQFLIRIDKNGAVTRYDENFESVSLYGNKYFDNLLIDRENEKVTFRYDKDYEINLKTGEMK